MHFAKMVDSHLEDGNFVLFRKVKDSKRKSDSVVKIALCLKNVVFLGKNRSDRLFCAGLSDTSGDSDNFDIQLHPVKCRDVAKRFFTGFNVDARAGKGRRIFFCKGSKCALLHYLRDKSMSVYTGTFERNKKKIYATQTVCGICGKPVDFSYKFPHPLSPCIDHIIPIVKGGHPSDLDNLQLAHFCCNRAKSDKLVARSGKAQEQAVDSPRVLPLSRDWTTYRSR